MSIPDQDGGEAVKCVSEWEFQVCEPQDAPQERAPGDRSPQLEVGQMMRVEYSQPMTALDWMTEADPKILGLEGHEAVSWGGSGRGLEERNENRI
jgi:hypothetical protein